MAACALFSGLALARAVSVAPATFPPTAATSTVIDFDDYRAQISGAPAAPEITNRYERQGVTFPDGVTALRYNSRSFPPRPDLPASPEVAITTCYSREFCANRIVMAFTAAMQRVTVLAGTSSGLPAGENVLFTAFADDGSVVAREVRTLPAAGGPIPIRSELTVQDETGRIRSAQVDWARGNLLLDDLTLTPFLSRTAVESDPRLIAFTLQTQPMRQIVTITNTGNVTLTGLRTRIAGEPTDAGPITDLSVADAACREPLPPGRSCRVVVTARPHTAGTASSRLVLIHDGPGDGRGGVPPLLTVPISVTVAPAPAPSPPATSAPPSQPTDTSGAGLAGVDGQSLATYSTPDPWVWLVLMIAIGAVTAPLLSRRMRRPRTGPVRLEAPQQPRISVHAGHGTTAVSGPLAGATGPVLTLTAVLERPQTTLTLEDS